MLEVVRNARYCGAEDCILSQRRLILRLRGLAPGIGSAGALPVDEEKLYARIQSRNPLTRCFPHSAPSESDKPERLFSRTREPLDT
jgi:hypothetical protein